MANAKKLPSGKWRCLVYVGRDENGKRKYKSFTADTRKEAEFLAAAHVAHKIHDESIMTIGRAVKEYIESKDNVLSPSTVEGYRTIERNRIASIKDIQIADFDTLAAQRYVNGLSKKLSPKTVRNTWGLIAAAISMQEPGKKFAVTFPAKRKIYRELPTAAEVIAAVKGTNVELPTLLAMWLSLRMSEVRGLKYKDIKNGVLTVQRSMLLVGSEEVLRENNKTYDSTRRIRLPSYLINVIGTGRPDEFIVKEGKNTIYDRFVTAIDRAGLPHMRFHDLRHLNASVLLELGIPEKYAMERGGWSTPSTLQNVYQHTFSKQRKLVDDKVDRYFEEFLD